MSDKEKNYQNLINKFNLYGAPYDVVRINFATPAQVIKYLRDTADGIESGQRQIKSASILLDKNSLIETLEINSINEQHL